MGLMRNCRVGLHTTLILAAVAIAVYLQVTDAPTSEQGAVTPVPTLAPASSTLHYFMNGRWLEQENSRLASSIKELGWVQDGIDDAESEVVQDLLYIAAVSQPVASSVVGLGWVQDGIDGTEAEAIAWINNTGGAGVASSVVALGWVQDSVDDVEVEAIENLSYIANRDASAALRIVGMPFLETIEPPDVSAMASLGLLAAFDRTSFQGVMSHPTIRDGMTNDWVPVVATLRGVAETNAGLVGVLLDPDRVLLERRTITLPLSGEVILYVIRTGPGAARSMDLLEHSVRGAEEYMGAPLPTNYIGLLYEDAVSGTSAGANLGTHIAVLPEYDVDDGSHEAENAGSVIAHEVAHYYWSGNADWVDEGAADFMASIIEGARSGRPIGVTNHPCAYAASIAELESLDISRGNTEFGCNYSLGERLFVNLYRMLGDERFRQGFRDLYLASEVEDNAEEYEGTRVGVEHIMEAFRSDDGAANTVIGAGTTGPNPTTSHTSILARSTPICPASMGVSTRLTSLPVKTVLPYQPFPRRMPLAGRTSR